MRCRLTVTVALTSLLFLLAGCRKSSDEAPQAVKRSEPRRVEEPEKRTEPAPAPVQELTGADFYRAQPLDPKVRAVPWNLATAVKQDPEQHIGELAAFLVADADDDFHRVKRIHDWVADNIRYDVESYYGDLHNAQTGLKGVLSSGQSVCEGYATLFERLSQEAGFTVHKVSGYARGASYDPFRAENVANSNHAWNVVTVEGRPVLIDTTWDAGSVKTGKTWEKRYSTEYLFCPAEAFIHTHFPTDSRWQLLSEPVSAESFTNLPYLRGRFFLYGLALEQPVSRLTATGAEASLAVRLPAHARVTATLNGPSGTRLADNVLVQQGDGKATVDVRFPAPGDWQVRLFVGPREQEGPLHLAAGFAYRARQGSDLRFPTEYKQFSDLQCRLESPMTAPLQQGSKVPFRIRVPGVAGVAALVDGEQWTHLEEQAPGLYSGEVRVDGAQTVRLLARLHPDDERFEGLLEFPVQ